VKRLLDMAPRRVALLYAAIDGVCIGMGMGVPIFNIALGFPLGVYLAARVASGQECSPAILRAVLRLATGAALITMVFLIIIWAPWTRILFDPHSDLTQTGIPMLLYDPRASFVGWQVLMMAVSPFLQLLTTVLAAVVVLATPSKR
jgi:hypothetical protein